MQNEDKQFIGNLGRFKETCVECAQYSAAREFIAFMDLTFPVSVLLVAFLPQDNPILAYDFAEA